MLIISDNGGKKQWQISASDLRSTGIRSPQGFTMTMGYDGLYYWTTNEFAAYLFYTRYGMGDSQVEDQFEQRKQQEQYLYDLSYATDSEQEFSCPEGVAFYPYQKATIEYGLISGNLLIADQMRVGKTAPALGLINELPNINKVLIVCPKTAKPGWYDECKTWLIRNYKIQILEATSVFDDTAEVYLVHYDVLDRHSQLQTTYWDCVIGDEIHLVRKMERTRSRYFFGLKGRHKFGLTGTALPNQADNLLTVCKWIDEFWTDWQVKRDHFIHRNGITLTLEEVQRILRSSMMVRRVQGQVFQTEPPERRIITLDPPDEYKDLILAERKGLQDYGGKRKRVLGLGKVRYALNHINTYTSDGDKMVVFCYHKEVVERLATSLGNRAVKLYGDSTTAEREEAKRRFKEDPNCNVFIGSIGAASMALSLMSAYHILFVEMDFRADLMEQASDRCSDRRQTNQVLVEYLVYSNSLDEYILQNLDTKADKVGRSLNLIY